MKPITERIQDALFASQDPKYQCFQSKLMPTIPPECVIGVRVPVIRKMAKEFAAAPDIGDYLNALPHRYYEEKCLHGYIIEKISTYDDTIEALNRFLPYVDNWATCDSMNPKSLKKEPEQLLKQIRVWLESNHTYTVRYAIGLLMRYYLDDRFDPEYLQLVASAENQEYYVNMMIAWYFATALYKQYDDTLEYFMKNELSVWTHNKAIQKAIESNRISTERKMYLKTLKRK